MSKPAITRVSSLSIEPSPTNRDNGLYIPRLTAAEVTNIPTHTLRNGMIYYDIENNRIRARINDTWQTIAVV